MEEQRLALIMTMWLFSSQNLQHASAFNLDNTNILRKSGEPGSLFGFSLTMHHQLKPTDQQFLLVGAPHAKALPSQKGNITGGLFRCKFTTQSDDCERIPVDTKDSKPGQGLDHRENQWMGVNVKSQGPGGKVVVCAHRYQQWIHENQLILGRCFILKESLIVEETKTFCSNRGSSKEDFGYCQQGVSAAFTKDKDYIVFSGPGAYDWKGFSLDTGTNVLQKGELVIVAGAPRSNLSGEVLLLKPVSVRDQRNLCLAHILQGQGLASSFGYSLAVMDLNADGWDDIVVGAPQYTSIDMDEETGGAVYVYINRRDGRDWDRLQPDVLIGNKGSMFGLAVANIGDINQDGYNDLAVGAPYDNDGNGAVYIYLGKTGHLQKENQVLQGTTHQIKLFGYSLTGNMDIDGNGYPDVAVGSLSDTVHVYRSKPVISIEKSLTLTPGAMNFLKEDCQKGHCFITAKTCFSYTTYPGMYNPSLKILYKLNADDQRVQNGQQSRLIFYERWDQNDRQSRFIFNEHLGNISLQTHGQKQCVRNHLRLRADTKDKLTEITVSMSVSLLQSSPLQTLCQSSLPALEPVLNDLQPQESTAKFMFLNPECGRDNICQSNLQLQYTFCNKQQHLDLCSPLAREDGVAVISPGAGTTALEITVTNQDGDEAHLAQLVANFPESLPLLSVVLKRDSELNVKCDVDGTKTRAECDLGNPFRRNAKVTFYLLLNTDLLSPSVTDVNVTLSLQTISVQNITAIVAEARVFLDLQVFGQAKPSQVYYREEEEKRQSDKEIGEPVQYQFSISNMVRPLKSFTSVTLNIQWPKENKEGKWLFYLLNITGPNNQNIPCSPVSEINPLKHAQEVRRFHISISRHLLFMFYFFWISVIGYDFAGCVQVISRSKREVKDESRHSALGSDGLLSLFGSKRHYKYLTCDDELKCVQLRCPLKAADRTAVTLHSLLWSSTFIEEYSSLKYLDIVLNASLSLDGSQKNFRLGKYHTQVRLTIFPEKKPTFLSRIPWWVILLIVVLTLLLLCLLTYFLYKLRSLDCSTCRENKKYHSIYDNQDMK
ncbi:hypothetical protein HF521_018197 [Silurus meridionalis]|uniref:Integrin alpha-2 domain-containing protein n=1 Tax=Silurus meridionalis TaxID=175797 RepID=A0A8T0BIQ4_SILME|nr:hypothetical protein HF521_018197 [Silurus meridionalis]